MAQENNNQLPQIYQENKSLTVSSPNKYELERIEKINEQERALVLFKENIKENNSLVCNYAGSLVPETARKSLVQLSAIKKDLGEKQTAMMIMELLAEAGKLTGVEIDAITQGTCAKMIMQEYWALKYDEIIYVIRQGAIGGLGEVSWKGLSVLTIMQWFKQYMIIREHGIYSEHDERKNSSGNHADRIGQEQSFTDLLGGIIRDKEGKIIRNKSEE